LGRQDAFWIPASLGLGLYGQLRYRDMEPADTAALDRRKDLWAFDRWAAGMRSPAADLASNAAIAPLLALPMAVTAWESWNGRQAWGGAVSDAVVYGEALTFSSGLDLWVRSLRVHPRPLVYDESAPAKDRLSGEASGSFYSGHANAAFLSAVYFAYTWSQRHPGDEDNAWVWAGALGAATTVAGLRVAAGKHFLSDVAVGAAAGSAFGFLFPWLHKRGEETGGKGLGVMLGPEAYPVLVLTF
jgi:membrane-associated phospholipid phosphatase